MKEVTSVRIEPEIKQIIEDNDINISKIIEKSVKEKVQGKKKERMGINSLYIGFGLLYLFLSPMILLIRDTMYPAILVGTGGLLFIILGVFGLIDIGRK